MTDLRKLFRIAVSVAVVFAIITTTLD